MDRESASEAHKDYISRYLKAIRYAKTQKGEENVRDEDIAKAVGRGRETVTNWKWRGMPKKYISAFCAFCGVNEEWLAFNKEPMTGKNELPQDAKEMLDLFLKSDEEERAAFLKIMRRNPG